MTLRTLLIASPLKHGAVAMFALTGLFGVTGISQFIDCTDSFWAIACEQDAQPDSPAGAPAAPPLSLDALPAEAPDQVLGISIAIDADPVCEALENGFTYCHS